MVFLEIDVTAPRRLVPVSGDRVSSADDPRKICLPEHRLKCDLDIKLTSSYGNLVIAQNTLHKHFHKDRKEFILNIQTESSKQ